MKHFLTLLLVALVGSLQAETPAKKSGQSTATPSKSKTGSGQKTSSSVPKSNTKSGTKSSSSSEPKSDTAKTEAKTNAKTESATEEPSTEGPETEGPPVAAVSSIEVEDIQNFEHYAPQIQELIRQSLALTKQNLTYTFGSADPKKGGMDCSGTIYYVLHEFGFKDVPRQSNEMAGWVKDKTLLNRVEKADTLEHPEFASLQPGNLLFWSGTYAAGPREIPVTHVMLYLGKLKKGGKHVVFGASDGRAYQGKRRTGVSVFDFSLPRSTSSAKFYGYGMIPGVGKIVPKVVAVAPVTTQPEEPAVKKTEEATAQMTEPTAPQLTEKSSTLKTSKKEEQASTVAKIDKTAAIQTSKKVAAQSSQLAVVQATEEVRTALRVETEKDAVAQNSAKKKEATATATKATATKSGPSTAKTTPKTASRTSSSSSAKRSTPQKSNNQSHNNPRRQPQSEPSTMDKAKRGVGNFINDVRRAF